MRDQKSRFVQEGSSFLLFCAVGVLGLIVDAGGLVLLLAKTDLNAYWARVVSIAFAVSVTWAAHRLWTFKSLDNSRLSEWARYQVTSALGAATNFAVYSLLLASQDGVTPLLALAISSICALFVNFMGARFFAFGARTFRPT